MDQFTFLTIISLFVLLNFAVFKINSNKEKITKLEKWAKSKGYIEENQYE